jgi:hypothetical protein
MIGIGLEMPEIRAWAGTELSQIFANAIIVLVIIIAIAFVDVMAVAVAVDADLDLPACTGVGTSQYDNCLQAVANEYLSDYVDTTKGQMKNILVENVKAVNYMNQRGGLYCTSILCAMLGITTTFAANYVLDSDMYTILFEYYGNLLSFQEAQLFFVNQVSYKLGPVLLAVGIVARAFFFTRKIGGLLIAVALGITFFLPGMYIFDWATLDMAVTGDKGLDSQENECPVECDKPTPIAYYYNDSGLQFITSPQDFKGLFTLETFTSAGQLYQGTVKSALGTNGSADGKVIHSCLYQDDAKFPFTMSTCPIGCRTLPYPSSSQCLKETIEIDVPSDCKSKFTYGDKIDCVEDKYDVEVEENEDVGTYDSVDKMNITYNVQKACAEVPKECKTIKMVEGIEGTAQYESCPSSCKVVPPLKSDCRWKDAAGTDPGDCLESSVDCRIAKISDLNWRPTLIGEDSPKEKACKKAKDCISSLNAYESCTYVFPDVGPCEDLCGGCDEECRITGGDLNNLPNHIKDHCNSVASACAACHDTCKVNISRIATPAPGNCTTCPGEMRLLGAELPEEYSQGGCSFAQCAAENREFIPRSACEMCLFTEEAYAYKPPINNKCDELCKPSDDVPMKDAEAYSKVGAEGLVGKADIQSLSKLMLPIYVLPLFNIVATLVFIRGLSRMLGGDIEIPGISKVF